MRSVHFFGERATRFTLDARVESLTALESVHFASNHAEFEGVLGLEHLGRVPTLRHLGLSLGRGAMPREELFGLTQLRDLELRGDFSALPGSIGRLRNLRRLTIASLRLTTLPDSIGELTELTHLVLRGSRLESLPRGIGGLVRLVDLFVEDNRLTGLPAEIGELRSLERLLLGRNRLASLPASFARLPRLQLLDVTHNTPLAEVPVELTRRPDLRLEVEPAKLPAAARDEKLAAAERAFARLDARARELERPALRFVTHPGDGPVTTSKVGGTPFIARGESLPTCPICAEPLAFLVQIDRALAGDGRSGMLQVFGCAGTPSAKRLAALAAKDEGAIEPLYREHLRALFATHSVERVSGIAERARAWGSTDADREALAACRVPGNALEYTLRFSCRELVAPGSGGVDFARVVDAARVASLASTRPNGPPPEGPEPRRIVQLVAEVDRPTSHDLGMADTWQLLSQLTESQRNRVDGWTLAGDKLGGHPRWLQDRGSGVCPICGSETTRLELSLAGSEDDLLPEVYGSSILYVTSCVAHPDALAWEVQNG